MTTWTSTELPGRSRTGVIICWLKSRALAVGIVLAVLFFLASLGQFMGFWNVPYFSGTVVVIAVAASILPGIRSWVWFFKERRRRANPGQNWSVVQRVEASRRVRVEVRNETVPHGRCKVTGTLIAASADSLTLALRDGASRTIPISVVRKVSLSESVLRSRRARWLTALAACGALVVILVWQDSRLLFLLALIVLISELSYKPIYSVAK